MPRGRESSLFCLNTYKIYIPLPSFADRSFSFVDILLLLHVRLDVPPNDGFF